MAAKQVREVLEANHSIHSDFVERLADSKAYTVDFRYDSILDFVKQVELDVAAVGAIVDRAAPASVLNTYIRYYPQELELEAKMLSSSEHLKHSSDPVRSLLSIKQCLIDILDCCISSTLLPETKQLLENIRDFELAQLQNLSRQYVEWMHEN